jgi:predicted Zn-dependent protease
MHLAVVPIGRVDAADMEAAVARAVRVWRRPLEVRESLPVPRGSEDAERGQHRAAVFMNRLGAEVLKLKPGKLVGSSDPEAKTPLQPDGFIFVTDVDLFTAKTEGVVGALITSKRYAVISVRRLREAFHKRRADPNRQRARLNKELLRMAARLAGLPECADPECVLASSKALVNIDAKEERYCRDCEQRLFEGKMHI